jgi:hypothetical protein
MTRTIKVAQKRAQRRVNQVNNFARLKAKSQPQDRAEALSTIKRTTFVRG